MKKTLIDVSEHQGNIAWEKAMYHIEGAIMRGGATTKEGENYGI